MSRSTEFCKRNFELDIKMRLNVEGAVPNNTLAPDQTSGIPP